MKNWFTLKKLGIVTLIGILGGISSGIVSAQSPEQPPHVPCQAMSNLFGAFDLSPMQLRDYLANGGTISELAEAKAVDLPTTIDQWSLDIKECTKAAVEAGVITSERGDVILSALVDGSLTPFPRLTGSQSVNPEGVFMPGGWGARPNDVSERPRPGQGASSLYDSPGDDTVRPAPDGVFSPGGWGWVDRPDLADITEVDWVGHPYYRGIFMPGGWGIDGVGRPNGVFHPGGWGYTGDEAPALNDTAEN